MDIKEKLILEVEQKPILYDKSNALYKRSDFTIYHPAFVNFVYPKSVLTLFFFI